MPLCGTGNMRAKDTKKYLIIENQSNKSLSRASFVEICRVMMWKKSPHSPQTVSTFHLFHRFRCFGALRASGPFSPQMEQGRYRMVQQHAWSGISHHFAYTRFHIRFVAVYLAQAAGFLLLPERTLRQSCLRIVQQLPALRTQLPVPLLVPAVKAYHLFHCLLFLFYSRYFLHLF